MIEFVYTIDERLSRALNEKSAESLLKPRLLKTQSDPIRYFTIPSAHFLSDPVQSAPFRSYLFKLKSFQR